MATFVSHCRSRRGWLLQGRLAIDRHNGRRRQAWGLRGCGQRKHRGREEETVSMVETFLVGDCLPVRPIANGVACVSVPRSKTIPSLRRPSHGLRPAMEARRTQRDSVHDSAVPSEQARAAVARALWLRTTFPLVQPVEEFLMLRLPPRVGLGTAVRTNSRSIHRRVGGHGNVRRRGGFYMQPHGSSPS